MEPGKQEDYRFGGIERLYGSRGTTAIRQAKIAVVGIGGVGSWAAEALARSGVGQITLIDLDEICITNVNRQIHALDGQIGRAKTEAMAERIRSIHPGCDIHHRNAFFTERSAMELLEPGFDAVIDAIDSTNHKALLLAECHRRRIHAVCCGGAGGRRDPTRIRVADLAFTGKDPLLHQIRRRLREQHGFPKAPMGTKPEPFGIEAVYSDEAPWFHQCDGTVTNERPSEASGRINCNTGLGTAAHVTATFGLIAAGRTLDFLVART